MKIVFFSEDSPEGNEQDWPVVPRVGELITFTHPGGTDTLVVSGVMYYATTHGKMRDIRVDLVYPGAGTYMLHELKRD